MEKNLNKRIYESLNKEEEDEKLIHTKYQFVSIVNWINNK